MSARHLTVVPDPSVAQIVPAPETQERLSDRIRRLQEEARGLAQGHIAALVATLGEAIRGAAEVAEGGEAYPVGARELCRRLADDLASQANTLTLISERG